MTDTPPADTPPGDASPSPEALPMRRALSRRLHVVDALTPPPAPDFAARAIAAARGGEEEPADAADLPDDATAETGLQTAAPIEPTATVVPLHRRRWSRVLVGVAAAVALGAVAVPTIPRLVAGSSSSTVSGASAARAEADSTAGASYNSLQEAAAGPAAPPKESGPLVRGSSPAAESLASLASGVATGPTGSSSDLTPVVAELRARLTAPPYDVRSVVLQTNPTRVEITVLAPAPAALEVARSVLPAGTPIELLVPSP